jgi:hypothetical protein
MSSAAITGKQPVPEAGIVSSSPYIIRDVPKYHPVSNTAGAYRIPTPFLGIAPDQQMAAAEMAQEAPGQTLQATAQVHEAYNCSN